MPDHVGAASTFAPLVSAADVTTDLRVGSLVVNNDLFHPLRLAQEAATVDLLVDGRLELGLGAGWEVGCHGNEQVGDDGQPRQADHHAAPVRSR